MTDLSGLSAVVTGEASGISLAIAARLADGGARVACETALEVDGGMSVLRLGPRS